ncbi:hypothetical protein [Streptomyces sp. NPDC006134]|uniref:hypothetical protein n=1 Tax=Streptomyces sp. NPDC006134 TaxID=3154467 RepID=UPI0034087FC6
MTVRRDVHEELRARLRAAAAAHEPDRARILARVERGRASGAHPPRRAARPRAGGWARVAGATAAVAGVLVAGGYTVASAVKEDAPSQRRPAAVPPVTAPAAPAPPPSPDATGRVPAPPAGPAPGASPGDGPVWSDGAVDPHSHEFWAQSNVTLGTRERLSALTVRLEIRQTGGVSSTGAWRSLPEDDFVFTAVERNGFLVYTWVLKPGRTVPAGRWVFAGQYDHERGGRDARADRYAMTATTTAGAERLAVRGGFAAPTAGNPAPTAGNPAPTAGNPAGDAR